MHPERQCKIGSTTIKEYYWAGDYPVYVDNQLSPNETYEQAIDRVKKEQNDL